MRRKNLIYFFVLCLISLSGCSGANFFDVQSAMNVPKLSEDQQGVQMAINSCVGEDVIWKYARFEDSFASFIKYNLNEDSEPLYIAFCAFPEESHKVHALFVKKIDNVWKVIKDAIYCASDIRRVSVQDVDEDGEQEILITSGDIGHLDEKVNVYKCRKTEMVEVIFAENKN